MSAEEALLTHAYTLIAKVSRRFGARRKPVNGSPLGVVRVHMTAAFPCASVVRDERGRGTLGGMDGGWRAAVEVYAESQPTFGGVFVQDGRMIVLFTDHVERHRRAITPLLPRRARVVIGLASRSWAELQRAQDRVTERVLGRGDTGATVVGLELDGDQPAVVVTVHPYTHAAAERVRELAAPDDVIVQAGEGRPLPA